MIKCVVPVSGGKDSQACLQLALEHFAPHEVRGLFCDTKFEHPLTYAHVEVMRHFYGVQIDTVCAGSVEQQCLKHGRFPGGGARFCTKELKIVPSKKYYRAFAQELGHGFEVWYGMRAAESAEREKRYWGKVCDELYAPHDVLANYPKYLAKMGVMFRLAVLHWTDAEVFAYLSGMQNPLYLEFDRVGCFPCLAAGDAHKEKAFAFDDFGRSQYRKTITISQVINKNVFTSKGGIARHASDFQGCAICTM